MIQFILNNEDISTDLPPGFLLLDFIRYQKHLSGTKIGCREGDCGACTVLIGEIIDNRLLYRSATSCLSPLGNIHNKHIITIEGLNLDDLTPIQQAMCDEGGTQCGFCTPGFIVSMAGFCLSHKKPSYENAIAAVDGNICRCTGYKSIERALETVNNLMAERKDTDPVEFVTSRSILPKYLTGIKDRLAKLKSSRNTTPYENKEALKFVGGGTDLYVQQHHAMVDANIHFTSSKHDLKGIKREGNLCIIGASTTVSEFINDEAIRAFFPEIQHYAKLVSSTPIRNIATLAGNFVNASPIGDFSVFFIALDASVILKKPESQREIKLKDLYVRYKQLDKLPDELLTEIRFELPDQGNFFHFEKVSKRTHLDIASVNTAISLTLKEGVVATVNLSAGGVAPIPKCLSAASSFLVGKRIDEQIINRLIEIVQTEIAPISDARGSEEYKRLLLSQLIKAHFLKLSERVQL